MKVGELFAEMGVDLTALKKGVMQGDKIVKNAASGMEASIAGVGGAGKQAGDDVARGAARGDKALGSLDGRAARTEMAIRNVGGGADSMAKSISSSVDRAVDDLGNKLGAAADRAKQKLKDIDPKTLALGGAAVGIGLAATYDDAAVSAGRLQARLGLNNREARRFDAISKEVYRNNFGESMVHAADVTALVAGATGLVGKQLRARTMDVFRITDAFEDLGASPEMLATNLQILRKNFPDKTEAQLMDLISNSFQKGTGRAGDLLETLNEYPGFFSEIGLTADDMFNIIDQGMLAGARDTDKLADAVKEFGIRVQTTGDTGQRALQRMFGKDEMKSLVADFGRGGEAGRAAFFKVLDGLKAIQDPTERYTESVELFGTMAEDIGKKGMNTLIDGLSRNKDMTSEAEGATQSLDAQYTGLGATLETLKRKFQTGILGPLGNFGGYAEAGIAHAGSVGMALAGMAAAGVPVGTAFLKMGGMVVKAMGWIKAAILTNPWALLVVGIIAAAVLIYKNWDTIKEFLAGAFRWIREVGGNIWNALRAATGNVIKWIIDRWATFVEFFFNVADKILAGAEFAFGWMGPIGDKVKKFREDFNANGDRIIANMREQAEAAGRTGEKMRGEQDRTLTKFEAAQKKMRETGKLTARELKEAAREFAKDFGVSVNTARRLVGMPIVPHKEYRPIGGRQRGGGIGGSGTGDKVPIMAEPGEYMLNRNVVRAVGTSALDAINFGAAPRFQKGGRVGGWGRILELLYPANDPDHDDHLHAAAERVVALGRRILGLQAPSGRSFLVGEHPAFGGVGGGHSPTGYHPRGMAIDVNTLPGASSAEQADLNWLARWIMGRGGGGMLSAVAVVNKALQGLGVPQYPGALGGVGQSQLDRVRGGLLDQVRGWLAREGSEVGTGGGVVDLVRSLAAQLHNWTGAQWTALRSLISSESGFNPTAPNPTSSAYGLFQFLDSTWATVGGRKTSDPHLQTKYGLRYIDQRYGTPSAAWAFKRANNWYSQGGQIPAFGNGAVINSPTLGLLGEKREREFVTPERMLRQLIHEEGMSEETMVRALRRAGNVGPIEVRDSMFVGVDDFERRLEQSRERRRLLMTGRR